MNGNTPDRKVTIGALVSAVTAIAVWGFNAGTGIAIPAEIAIAFNTVLIFTVQYFAKNNK